jgi:hypothetical protein
MTFGLTNAPATFCTLYNELFHPYDGWYTLIVGYSHLLNDHVSHLRTFFKALRKNHLYVKKDKCSFRQTEILFLGHWMGIRAIEEWQVPTKVSKLRFRARELLPKIHRKLFEEPLKNILKKDVRTDHGTDRKSVKVEDLKQAVMDDPVLQLPDYTKPFEVHTVRLCHRRCASTIR